ncbi:MAG TPA: APC family permease [Gemmatimonadales bacterium]|nr:APC family permease [Gemmatimonadales bacterium]
MESRTTSLRHSLGALEYFTFGFGSMVGAGWLVVMDDWLGRGGPGGAMLGFLGGALLLMPVALTYGRLVRMIPDAGAEIAYTERVFPTTASFIAGWMMVLAYAIVCPWEAVAIGNLLARLFPAMNAVALYTVAGKVITLPRLVAGLVLTAAIGIVNYRGIKLSGRFQDVMTIGLLACFALFVLLGIGHGTATNLQPLFAPVGPFVSVLLVLQIVPYFMAGFESIPKASEEALPGLQPATLSRLITAALVAGGLFYVVVVGIVSWVYPWTGFVGQHLGTDAAFARTFGTPWIARLILAAAVLSLFKVFNGNFVAATRLVYALGRRRLVLPALGTVNSRFGTPATAIALVTLLTGAAAFLGDAVLVPISEVGAAAAPIGWCAACLAFMAMARRAGTRVGVTAAGAGACVSIAIMVIKVVPGVPGSFTAVEWLAFITWCVLGLALRQRVLAPTAPSAPSR